jgi:hypothetical protein
VTVPDVRAPTTLYRMSSRKRYRSSILAEESSNEESSLVVSHFNAPRRLGVVSQPNNVTIPALQRDTLGVRHADRRKRAREEMIETLTTTAAGEEDHTNADLAGGLEHLLQVSGALVTMNKEIWDRCSERVEIKRAHSDFRKQMKESRDCRNLGIEFVARGLESGQIAMRRAAYSIVKVDPIASRARTPNTAFRAMPVEQDIIFRLPSLPAVLETMVHSERFDDCFMDYEAFLDRASCLHDDVLEHFLVHFKSHLEEVQVCLGEIDRWAMYCDECVSKLETTFDMELPHLNEVGSVERMRGHLIKSFKSTGSISLTFNLDTENERAKLKKFVDFSEL